MDADDRRRLRRRLFGCALLGIVLGMTIWRAIAPPPGSAVLEAVPPPAATSTTPAGRGGGLVASAPPEPIATAPAAAAAATSAAAVTATATTASRSVAAGAGTVVAVAVDVAQQANARDHWTPDTMATAAAAPVPPLPRTAPDPTVASAPPVSAAAVPPASSSVSTSPTSPGPAAASPSFRVVTAPATPLPSLLGDLGTRWTGSGAVTRATGKVFFTRAGRDYTCSATALSTSDASTVLTAAHCVVAAGVFASRWVFVPGWSAQAPAPSGMFVATHFAVPDAFLAGDVSADVAFVNVAPDATGTLLGTAVGGLPIGFGATPSGVHAFGYPQVAPFDGTALVHCSGPVRSDDRGTSDLGLACGMTAGASGGPWLADVDAATGSGTVVSVTSFAYADAPGTLYGPALGAAAQRLYDAVSADPAL